MSHKKEPDMEGPQGENQKIDSETWATLSMIISGVTLAQAVKDPALADEIAFAVKSSLRTKSE